MDPCELLYGLQFYNHQPVHEQIDFESFIEMEALELESHWLLSLDGKSISDQTLLHDGLVDRFQQTWTERGVHAVRGFDDASRDAVDLVHEEIHKGQSDQSGQLLSAGL